MKGQTMSFLIYGLLVKPFKEACLLMIVKYYITAKYIDGLEAKQSHPKNSPFQTALATLLL